MATVIRPATPADLPGILEIYNHYVVHSTATFDLEPRSPEAGALWLGNRSQRHPVVVAVSGTVIVGWASLSSWSAHGGYAHTAELSIYARPGMTGLGTGTALIRAILNQGRDLGHRCIIARITVQNERSRAFHQRQGFEVIGIMRQAGKKHGRLLDVTLLQHLL